MRKGYERFPVHLYLQPSGPSRSFHRGQFFPPRTTTIGKKSLRWIPVWGWVYYLGGNLLIDRGRHDRAMGTIQDAETLITEKRVSIWIFPEGTRSRGKEMGPFKKGAFHLALGTGLPLVPVTISSYTKRLNLWRWRAGTVLVDCMDPIPTRGTAKKPSKIFYRPPMTPCNPPSPAWTRNFRN